MKIFRHSSKDIMLVAMTVVIIVLTMGLAIADLSLFWLCLIAPLHILLILNVLNAAVHYHTHWATFVSKKANHFYELLLSAASGSKPELYRLVHAIHHKYVNDKPVDGKCKDTISVFGHGVNQQPENAWTFCWRHGVNAWLAPWRYVFLEIWKSQKPNTSMMNPVQWHRQQLAIVVFNLLVLFINFSYGIWLMFFIYLPVHFLNYAWHYGEHHGSYQHRGDTTQDSVGIYSPWYNFLFFNAGYHQEHHHRPGVHWTKLPELTTFTFDV